MGAKDCVGVLVWSRGGEFYLGSSKVGEITDGSIICKLSLRWFKSRSAFGLRNLYKRKSMRVSEPVLAFQSDEKMMKPTSLLTAALVAGAASSSLCGVSQVVFLLDWDDTLCASSHAQKLKQTVMLQSGVGKGHVLLQLDEAAKREWRQLALLVKILLNRMLMISPDGVYIVTNSQSGWVELSIDGFMPELKPLLPKLKIISARSTYSNPEQEERMKAGTITEADLVDWKFRAFTSVLFQQRFPRLFHQIPSLSPLSSFCGSLDVPSIVALGDSIVDDKALETSAEAVGIPVTKWIKFVSQPSLSTLIEEIRYTCTILPALLLHKSSARITLNPDVFSNTPQNDPFTSPD